MPPKIAVEKPPDKLPASLYLSEEKTKVFPHGFMASLHARNIPAHILRDGTVITDSPAWLVMDDSEESHVLRTGEKSRLRTWAYIATQADATKAIDEILSRSLPNTNTTIGAVATPTPDPTELPGFVCGIFDMTAKKPGFVLAEKLKQLRIPFVSDNVSTAHGQVWCVADDVDGLPQNLTFTWKGDVCTALVLLGNLQHKTHTAAPAAINDKLLGDE